MSNELGWLQYLSKHAARGAAHYQRAQGSIPSGWEGMTGRMWGHLGDFPTHEPLGLELDDCGWFRFRRIVRGWRCAQARSERKVSPGRIKSARRMLCCSDFSLRVFVAFLNGFPCSWSSDYSLDFFLWTFCRIHHFLIFGDFNATVLFL